MQRFKKFIYYLFMYTWRKLQGRHSFGMFRTCLERAGKSSCLDIRAKERGSVLQLFRNATDKFAVLFRLALTHVPSLKCKPVVHGSKRFSRSLPTFPIANPLCSDSLASMPRLKSAITDKFRDGTAIDRPKFAEKTDTAKFAEVPEFHGITDIHTFNSFHSFYSFLRKTFFHTRYVLVTGKDTKKVSMPVYNLSIANDESYVIPLGIVHNCRCTVVQVRKDKYPVSNEQEAMNLGSQATAGKYQEMFMFNPGKRMTTFPAYNGYTLRKCNQCDYRPDKMKLAADIPDNEVCRACRLLQESISHYTVVPTKAGKLRIHDGHGKHEREENIRIGTYLAEKHGYEIDLLDNPQGRKSADSYNRTLDMEQEYKMASTPSVNAIDRLIRDGRKQADNIVLWLDTDIPLGNLRDAITSRIRRADNVQSLTIIRNGKDVTYNREDILKNNWEIKQADFK